MARVLETSEFVGAGFGSVGWRWGYPHPLFPLIVANRNNLTRPF